MPRLSWLACLGLLICIDAASAADLAPAPAPMPSEEFDKRWNFAFGIYGWAASLNGTVGVEPLPPVDVNLDFGDILSKLDIAFMAVAEARYGRWGVFGDVVYTRLSADESGPLGFVTASITNDVKAGTLMGQYRAFEAGRSSVDVMAGARLWVVSADAEVRTAFGGRLERTLSETWVDPMVGVKGRLQGESPIYATAWGLIGGFGVGSDVDWDVLGAVGYEINQRVSILAGYRAYGVDYDRDGFEFDVIQHGPVVSGIVRF